MYYVLLHVMGFIMLATSQLLLLLLMIDLMPALSFGCLFVLPELVLEYMCHFFNLIPK